MIKKRYTWLIYEYEVMTSVYTTPTAFSKVCANRLQQTYKQISYLWCTLHTLICHNYYLFFSQSNWQIFDEKKGGKITQIRQKCIFLGKKCCGCCLFLFTPWSDFGTTTKQLRKKNFSVKKKNSTFCPYGERILHCCFSLSFFFFFLFFLNRTVHESIWIF